MQDDTAQSPTTRRQHLLASGEASRGYVPISIEECDVDLSLSALGLLVVLRREADLHESDGSLEPRFLRAIAGIRGLQDRQLNALVLELKKVGLIRVGPKGEIRDVNFVTWCPLHSERQAKRQAWNLRQSKRRKSRQVSPRDTPGESPDIAGDGDGAAVVEANGKVAREDIDQICSAFVVSLEQRQVVKRTVTKGWRDAARLMLDRDGRAIGEVLDVIAWVTTDDFERSNVLSVGKLRDRFDQLRLKRDRSNGSGLHRKSLADVADQLERVGPSEQLLAARTAAK